MASYYSVSSNLPPFVVVESTSSKEGLDFSRGPPPRSSMNWGGGERRRSDCLFFFSVCCCLIPPPVPPPFSKIQPLRNLHRNDNGMLREEEEEGRGRSCPKGAKLPRLLGRRSSVPPPSS